jgi:hypothetical protein
MKTKMTIKNQKGAAIVEFAIVLPVLVLLAIGIGEFGSLVYNKQVIANASREGARAGIVSEPALLSNQSIKDIVTGYCQAHLITFDGPSSVVDDDIDLDPVDRTSLAFGANFRVTVGYNYGFLVPSMFKVSELIHLEEYTEMEMEDTAP